MSVPAFRNSRSRVRRRRSHHALKKIQVDTCAKCDAAIQPHRACQSCGHYNGRQVISMEQEIDKVLKEKKPKAKKSEKKEAEKETGEAKKTTKKETK